MAGPELRGARVCVRMLSPHEAALASRFHRDNREHLAPWDPARPPDFTTEAYWARQLAINFDELAADRGARLWIVELSSGDAVGTCNFANFVRGAFQACHLGYSVDHRREGKGYMSEALRLAIPYVFDELGMHRIMANYMPENTRSAHLLERLGFTIEGRARDYLYIAGAWRDHVLTSLINPSPRPPG